jgi:N-acetylated-alpha-linked acidic dipeptidase
MVSHSPRLLLSIAFLAPCLMMAKQGGQTTQPPVLGYTDFSSQAKVEAKFLAVPSAKLAGQHLKILTAEPHMAATPEDHQTAEYVARKFREAGLETEIVPYRVLLNQPKVVRVEAYDADGNLLVKGPTPEHVANDPGQNNPRVVMPFNGSSGSGNVTGEAVYVNYGRPEDFEQLAEHHIDLHGKIAIIRYGLNFRGVKVYLAEQHGAAGVLLYSDPQDDGYYKGDTYPAGPWRPDTGVQRGSVQFLFKYPGDPETPGVASTLSLPDSARIRDYVGLDGNQPSIISIPISYHDAAPILHALKGPVVPPGWQGALPFSYHMGPTGARVHLVSDQDYQRRVIWDVIGKVKGSVYPDEWVIAGNHRDGWVYGAVDPSSGTAAMLEAVHGVGALLKHGWRPKRTIVFGSWDAEEEGLIGSTEWVEQHSEDLEKAVAYFNVDVAVAGPNFDASAVPSLKEFVRGVARDVPSPLGGTVYEQWKRKQPASKVPPSGQSAGDDVRVGAMGSGSDFTPFLQRAGVPSTDIGSNGPYGVYHSTFDDYRWFTENADPHFTFLQEMARVLGLETIRMADADVLPLDYVEYAKEVSGYIKDAKQKALGAGLSSLDFEPVEAAANRFAEAASRIHALEAKPSADPVKLNGALRKTEEAFLWVNGLPNRPWYRHIIYAPGEFTGYSAVEIPGVNEAIDARNAQLAAAQLTVLTTVLDRAAQTLDAAE